MSKKFVITWDNMQHYCRELAQRQMPAEQWKGILGVSRGGLVPLLFSLASWAFAMWIRCVSRAMTMITSVI